MTSFTWIGTALDQILRVSVNSTLNVQLLHPGNGSKKTSKAQNTHGMPMVTRCKPLTTECTTYILHIEKKIF